MSEFTVISEQSESEIDRVARDFMFFAELYEQNREVELFVNESIILASGNKTAINEMYILNEAAAGDKIKAFFEKIKNFFKKIFDKLGASMNALFQEQKKFIEQYQFICTKCKYKAGDVNDMKNHFVGFPRILATVEKADQMIIGKNNDFFKGDKFDQGDFDAKTYSRFFKTKDNKEIDFSTVESIQNLIANPPEKANIDEMRNSTYQEFIKDNGWEGTDGFNPQNDANGNVNIDGDFRRFFDGSDDGMSFDMDTIENNWQTVLNTVYAGDAYLKTLDRINGVVVKKMDEVEKGMTTYIQNQNNKIKSAIGNLKVGDNPKPEDAKSDTEDTKGGTPPKPDTEEQPRGGNTPPPGTETSDESYNYGSVDSYLNEMNISTSSSSINNDNKKASSLTNVGTADNQKAREAQSNISSKTVATANVKDKPVAGNVKDDSTKSSLQKGAETVLGTIETNAQAQINANIQISSAISRQLYNAFQVTNKDFWSIIQAHVNWYLGNPGQEKQSENVRTNPTNINMNAKGNNPTVGKAPEATGNAETK